jgi:hypothetical protein
MTDKGGLFEEIHHLAYHYHWGEQEILAMPRSRRRQYLSILASKLEQMREALK